MIIPAAYSGHHVGVFGLARSGIAAAKALQAAGAHVYAWDDGEDGRARAGDMAHDLYALDFDRLDALMLAPGVPLTHPKPHMLVEKAVAAGVQIISDFDLFQAARTALPAHRVIAVTGTNGKSTVTQMLADVIADCGLPSLAAGNIGLGVMAADPLADGGVYVFEMSSFQIDLTRHFCPDIAVLLNITPDHLDRHGDMAGYVAAKARLFDLLQGGTAIVGTDDPHCRSVFDGLLGSKMALSTSGAVPSGAHGYQLQDGQIHSVSGGDTQPVIHADLNPRLRGQHNVQNIMAVLASCGALGLPTAGVLAAIARFPGLDHRQMLVADAGGIRFVNDSKATNVDAAMRALSAYTRIRWIAGGRAKGSLDADWSALSDTVRHAYLYGEAAPDLAKHMAAGTYTVFSGMDAAVAAACADAVSGDTVLLSPACTAFDQFRDFEARGRAFSDQISAYVESMT